VSFYADKNQMVKSFGEEEVIHITGGDAEIDEDVLNRCLADATSEIDSYIGKRYGNTLLVNTPPRLIGVCCDIARYRLYDDATMESVRARYLDAIVFLRDVRDGKNGLGDEAADAVAMPRVQISAAPRRFDRDSLRDY
jgi:phage gp36-like protein